MRMVVIHGMRTRDKGKGTTDRIAAKARDAGFVTDEDEGDYGFFGLLSIRFFRGRARQRVIARLALAISRADIVVTFSNGTYFATEALEALGLRYSRSKLVVHIAGALDPDTPIPDAVKKLLVLATPYDTVVKLSSLLLFHPYGELGAVGYTGSDPRATTVFNRGVKGHHKWFKEPFLSRTWSEIASFIIQNSET